MLYDIKALLNLEDDADIVLNLMMQDAIQSVLDYCHIKKLPPTLESLIRGIVARQFNIQNEGNINSIKRGDTQITYNEPIGIGCFTDIEKSRLNAYRKWKAR